MRPLALDYRQGNVFKFVAGLVLLGLALAATAHVGMAYWRLEQQMGRVQSAVEKVARKMEPGRAAAPLTAAQKQQFEAEIKSANDVVQRLNLPWDKMLAALETSNSDDIALLGIAPDAKKRRLQVIGEAKSFAALFDYIRILQESESLAGVYLRHHQIQEQDPEKPVRFTLEASWTEKR